MAVQSQILTADEIRLLSTNNDTAKYSTWKLSLWWLWSVYTSMTQNKKVLSSAKFVALSTITKKRIPFSEKKGRRHFCLGKNDFSFFQRQRNFVNVLPIWNKQVGEWLWNLFKPYQSKTAQCSNSFGRVCTMIPFKFCQHVRTRLIP